MIQVKLNRSLFRGIKQILHSRIKQRRASTVKYISYPYETIETK